ncbi:S-layer homology domain-containing protein [Brevibacillus brevis]|uniref:S-layer homology domain-containing protein n=1 Tax=Brevibacillus brevis TaxID=1393 RepID=A0A2Z4MMV9_BREBE|nr:YcdB/YcdC domain-containing protein [Brevibacillus brevis]AWX57798.1 S-layer homology domain-containing protein [Brevibacillus brevis]
MLRRATSWGLSLGVSSSILMSSVFATAGVEGLAPIVRAAEKMLSQEEAIKYAQKWVTIPGGYKLRSARMTNPDDDYYYSGRSYWNLTWEKNKVGSIYVTIDAVSGQLSRYSNYLDDEQLGGTKNKLTEEQAMGAATQFLKKVTTEEERSRLSKPNEYAGQDDYYFRNQGQVVRFTRMVNEIPFLGNGFQIILDRSGEVISFHREWYDGKLPEATKVIEIAEAEKKWEEKASPSLVYKDLAGMTDNYQQGPGTYELVYGFQNEDPQLVEATTGEVINLFGKAASKKTIKPLGDTISKETPEKRLITKEEAQKLAEQYVKRLPGNYRFDGSSGGGSSSGPGGISERHWSFDFMPQNGGKKSDEVEVDINDRGELVGYQVNPNGKFEETPKKMVTTWEQAEESATELVKSLLDDQLGEIYLIEEEPSKETLQSYADNGEHYNIQFGMLVNGIPVEDETFRVEVNPETGVAESLNKRSRLETRLLPKAKVQHIEQQKAKAVIKEQQKFQLAYHQPVPEWKSAKQSEPFLVYRYVGDNGIVKAGTGEWYSFVEAQKKQAPSDIDEHPQQAELEFALRRGWMTVIDGQLGPEKEVSRGEMAMIMAQMADEREFRNLRPSFDSDEERFIHDFADVPSSHPSYAAIQKNVEYKLIPKSGKNFEPDRMITRAEVADMVARMLGYNNLLDKPELFKSPYQDLQPQHIPAATLLSAHDLFKGKSATNFEPDATVTRAQIAELLKMIYDQQQERH